MKSNKHKTLLVFAVLVGAAVLSVGNGCSQSFTSGFSSNTESTTNNSAGGSLTNSDVPVIEGARTVSLVYSKQVVDQLASCTGLAAPSGATLAMYEQKKGAISTYGTAATMTSPMMVAVVSLAGEISNDLINQEIALGQRIFIGFDMSANSLPTESQLSDAVTRLSLSCWQRLPTTEEKQSLIEMVYASIGVNEAKATRKAALMLGTSMLSSLDALLN